MRAASMRAQLHTTSIVPAAWGSWWRQRLQTCKHHPCMTQLHTWHADRCMLGQVEKGGSSAPEYHVLAKGAPEVVQDHLATSSSSYASVYKEYAAQGAR